MPTYNLDLEKQKLDLIKNQYGENSALYQKMYSTMQDYLKEKDYESQVTMAQTDLKNRADAIANPNSDIYKNFRKGLTSTLAGANSTNALLAMVMAQGGSWTQAQEKIKALQSKINDSAIQGTDQFYQGMQGQANSLYTTGLNSTQNMAQYYGNLNLNYKQLAQQQYMYEDSQPSFFDNLLKPISAAASYAGGSALYNWMKGWGTSSNNKTPGGIAGGAF